MPEVVAEQFTRGRYMDKEIAEEVLLAGFPQDPDAVRFIVTELAKERPFLSIHGGAWRWLSLGRWDGPGVCRLLVRPSDYIREARQRTQNDAGPSDHGPLDGCEPGVPCRNTIVPGFQSCLLFDVLSGRDDRLALGRNACRTGFYVGGMPMISSRQARRQ
jgi:hypothetical protein